MMRIILLLLVTLMGPFCTFTQASTLVVPTASATASGGASATEPNLGSEISAVTDSTVETAHQDSVSTLNPPFETTVVFNAPEDLPVGSTAAAAAATTESETTAPTDLNQSTEAGNKETTDTETTTDITEGKANEPNETVNVEDEGMGTGQVVGIVIGALIAVIVVIAVIILVVRRMGQYSP
ncbi:uncharacterized protein si:ch211-156j16.1 isoform X2 [Puntigrus tetrazona]|uniref:uncharacterized protein si:ch211-156j16.1 isoform X2 n=1 Tax=Puntigrus tetrazona TaxID=1606681 RepID=UPI001C89305E|nr:uncharacterized protein si:ch211-156j16.1 isoform X2 [Puntigrus tetrazona]